MKIMFECDNGAYVLEVLPRRLYAKVEEDKNIAIRYSATISPLLNPASFHEYRGNDAMLQKKLDKAVSEDLGKVISNYGSTEETKKKSM